MVVVIGAMVWISVKVGIGIVMEWEGKVVVWMGRVVLEVVVGPICEEGGVLKGRSGI